VQLIDASSWIHALRKAGDPVVRARVHALLVDAQAAWCDVVRVHSVPVEHCDQRLEALLASAGS
jgi:hypothetical protein